MVTYPHPPLADVLGARSDEDPVAPPTVPGIDACGPLADLLHHVGVADRAHLHVVRALVELQVTAEVEHTTGVPLERWLEQYGRLPRSDRRMYATAATVLAQMPSSLAAWARAAISWGQVRIVVLETMRMPRDLWSPVDDLLAAESDDFTTADPDDLIDLVRRAVWELLPDRAAADEHAVHRDRFLSIQPSLLPGGSGKLYGEGPNHDLAAIADALDAMTTPPDTSPRDRVGADVDPDHDSIVTQGRRRWDALVWSLTNRTTQPLPDDHDVAMPGDLLARSGAPIELTVTCDLATLLGLADRPAHLTTTLTGGRMRVTADLARRLADAGGALRLLVVDDHGTVIGIGRRNRVAPDWLRNAITAMFPTSIGPGSHASSKHCDLDHHDEWHDGGPTDLDNLAPVDRRFHTAKTRGEWTITSNADGTRQIIHAASGWTQTIIPATRPSKTPDPPR